MRFLSRLPLLTLVLVCCSGAGIAGAQENAAPGVLPPPSASQLTLPAPTSSPELLSTPLLEPTDVEEITESPAAQAVEVLTPVYSWYQPAYWFGPTPWDIGLQFGLNGSEGSNTTQSFQVGSHIKRKTKFWKFNSNLSYNRNSSNGVETQNNAQLEARLDRRLDESPWSLYFLNQTQYDEFQAYDVRLALNTGIGYQFFDTDIFDLGARFGAGTSREFGGPDNQWAPEALFGLDSEYRLSDTQRLTGKVDYFPEWDNFTQYRIVSDAGWEIDLDKPGNVSLKFSFNDRYDSTPNGVEPNLLNYAVLLIWGL